MRAHTLHYVDGSGTTFALQGQKFGWNVPRPINDRIARMTQVPKAAFRWSRIALALAVIALGFAIGLAIKRQSPEPVATADSAAAPSGQDPFAALEARTREKPGDAAAWLALGAAYFDAGRFADAATAFDQALQADPGKALAWSSLGEARVMASERDPMPAEAAAAFRKAVALDPKDPRARYFLAVGKDLTGDHQGAVDDWLALLADTPPGAPWEGDLRRTIEQVAKINRINVAPRMASLAQPAPQLPVAARGIPGPTAEDLRAASAMPPGEQRQMAEGMVARLEAKLQGNPANIDGWAMLMRSRMTLDQPDKASAALKAAIAANPAQAARLRQEAGVLGVK